MELALNAQCLRAIVNQNEATGEVNCLLFESLAADTIDGHARCEEVPGHCTPGATPCRREGTDYPPVSAEVAASQLSPKIQVIQPDGSAIDEKVQAQAIGGNVYATGSDGKRHLVCEMLQLAGGRVPAEESQACLNDPSYGETRMPSTGGGWCYSRAQAIVGEACLRNGAPGKMRLLGEVSPRQGSEVLTFCIDWGSGGGC